MLDAFLVTHREAIVARTRTRVAARNTPAPTVAELTNGIPAFLDQLGVALRLARSTDVIDHEQIARSASLHGQDLLRMGLTIAQVVHDYGDVCQVVTEMAVEVKAPITGEEFRTLNLCLDDAIAGAVTEYSRRRERTIADLGSERLGVLAHELRNLVNTAILSFEAIQSGRVSPTGSTGSLHSRSLLRLRDLGDRSLADVRLDAGIEHVERISVADFIGELQIGASMLAQTRHHRLVVAPIDPTVTIEGDRQILAAAISNLLQNAFKFSREHGNISLTARATADRVLVEVEDECGGLPPGKAEELFRPFEQRGRDRTGSGLGLSISRKAAEANGGELRVRDLPGKGCVFTLDLPKQSTLKS